MQKMVLSYRQRLKAALDVHGFNRDADDTLQRINEKISLVSIDDIPQSLAVAETQLRKLETLERDMKAIDEKIKAHAVKAAELSARKPPLVNTMEASMLKLTAAWDRLLGVAGTRRDRLMVSYLFLFQPEFAELSELHIQNKKRSKTFKNFPIHVSFKLLYVFTIIFNSIAVDVPVF